MEPSETGPLGRFFFSAVLLSIGLLILVQLCLPPGLKIYCLFYRWTGFPCFTCGATRCVQHILAGELLSAWQTQPLVFLALLGGGTVMVFYAVAEIFRWPTLRIRLESRLEKVIIFGCLAAVVLLNWVYLIVTL